MYQFVLVLSPNIKTMVGCVWEDALVRKLFTKIRSHFQIKSSQRSVLPKYNNLHIVVIGNTFIWHVWIANISTRAGLHIRPNAAAILLLLHIITYQ